ncbi:CHASE4 domain-containing protein [Sphingomonas sp.]|jgi:signal transduction histidine kinase|uniref:CHASE4 domain-containing protein n=1 Tax=Sphingomonas sp. TaxID=28214 RepID=UPI002D80C7C8|nr:CHASE4 domain-containing protein [Sphingomonas sp.]HEU0044467.1 CHASE4 domain-containing protein [Sphingomonas sp.]
MPPPARPARHRRRWRWPDPASLGAKLVLILTATGLAGALGITVLLAVVITPNFNALERQAIDGHVERTAAALSEYGSKVESAVRDYGDWTASYEYMAQPTRAFEQESFSPLAMRNLGVQGMAYVAPRGRVVIARWLGRDSAVEQPEMQRRLVAAIARTRLERTLKNGNSGYLYMRVGPEVAAVGVAQVRRSDGSGTPRGHVVMARVLTSEQVAGLLRLDARIAPAAGNAVEILTPSRALAEIQVPVVGPDGPVATVRFGVRREVSLLGRRMLLLAVAGSTVLLLLVLLVLRRMIAQQVLKPLHRVEAHMQRVRGSGSLALLDEDRRRDEIGSLGRSFNAMLRQLNELREQIEVQSFALGRSESAVAVMHNVRNALNPVSTILSQGIAQPPPVERTMLDRAIAELARDDLPTARRHKLTAFVTAGLDAWATSRDVMRGELEVGREAMAHVLEIIGQQQKQAHERPPLEPCDVTEIVARNATIARYSDKASIAFSFPSAPHRVMANRVILSQVIGNLFGNAAEAIASRGTNSGAIAVTVVERDGEVIVSIRDDGEGFDGEVEATLFQRGFSTRAHKSGGLGLHWCANSMTAMEGALRLESAGRGQGAVAVLTLKVAAQELAEAA